MHIKTVGLAVLVAGFYDGRRLGPADLEDKIQQEKAPGSAIEMDIGRGGVVIGRQRNLNPPPVEVEGQVLAAPDDPDTPVSPDAIDAELPGEGPGISQAPTTTIRSPSRPSSASRVRRCSTGRGLGGFDAGVAPLPSARHEPTGEAAEAFACRLDA